MAKLPILLITICSHTKNCVSSYTKYSSNGSITNYLDNNLQIGLLNKRKCVLDLLKNPFIFRDEKEINELPSNKSLVYSSDFVLNSNISGRYIEAIKRYSGKFYQQLGDENQRFALFQGANIHLIIVSALYGVLLPFEIIQDYIVNVTENPVLSQYWQDDDILTQIIINYIVKNKIKTVFEIMGDDNYKSLI